MEKKKVLLVCDDCGCEIKNPHDGALAWGREDRQRKRVLVVHVLSACERWKHKIHNPPQQVKERGTIRLDCFMGRLGLLDLLATIEDGYWPVETGWELIRRFHVPGYEQYRLFRRKYNAGDTEYELLVQGVLLAAGLHEHRGQWRKRRYGKEDHWLAAMQGEVVPAQSGGSIQQAAYRQRRAESTQRRLLRATKTLAIVRALSAKGGEKRVDARASGRCR